MRESSQCWDPTRKALSPYGALIRVENMLGSGHPDVLYCLLGVAGLMECKVDLGTLSLNQVIWAETWSAARGLSWMLWRHEKGWALFNAFGMRSVFSRVSDPREVAVLWTDNKLFPTRLMLCHLAPPCLRRHLTYPG